MSFQIIGAGMAGLLAANLLRDKASVILERQDSLPNNHSAVLRFRSSVVGDSLGIPFKRVMAMKASEPWRNPVADAIAYSRKTNGTATTDRSISGVDPRPVERHIAPPDFIRQMAERIEDSVIFRFGCDVNLREIGGFKTISTIPMPALMDLLDYDGPRPDFKRVAGRNIVAKVSGADAYASLYVPDPSFPASRISITGNELVAECYGEKADAVPVAVLGQCAEKIGLSPSQIEWETMGTRRQLYAKILPVDESARRRFIMWASANHNVHSLGRFATWRPRLLMDDLVNDVRVIQSIANDPGATYPHRMKG